MLLNVAMSEHVPAGADDFLPMLIYVTIKASPLGNKTFWWVSNIILGSLRE